MIEGIFLILRDTGGSGKTGLRVSAGLVGFRGFGMKALGFRGLGV